MEKSVGALTSEAKLPMLLTPLPGPKARAVIARDAQFVSPSYTRGYPLVAKSGRGAMVEDVDGNMFLDFAAGIAVVSTGHCHPRVVEAIQKQAAELIHISCTDFYYPGLVELAERLSAVAPGKEAKKVYFGNSGTEAIEAAIKLARYHTRRDKIIAFHGCFHGRTLGALSLTASKAIQRKGFGTLLAGVFHIPYPNSYRCPYGNPFPCTCVESATFLEREIFKRLVDPEEVAAIFIEPIQGEGGYVPAPKEFLVELQRICRKHGILLVCDEVQSGMGRTGKWWASDHAGIEPDILCVAKGIASGMPLSATIARASLMDWKPGAHASTFGGNPVCVAAALATMDLLETQYIENARRVG
ncbi:MAG TPA: aminotransferase class III-fold pyridoxal phosphate-dependent enzyme, partial [Candidatus Acidoferrales bacterium]|nr:aminotransferase class III-fold pyridoxal phosphate-dependent enzyme [Candidatus Acidoferrales bacterium]